MYNVFSQISAWLSKPLFSMATNLESLPIIFALILGMVGAVAPCQLTGNISAITLYGNRTLQKKIVWKDVLSFTVGKIVAFSLLGALVWILGRNIEQSLTQYFPWLRKFMGPLLILVGLFMLGLFNIKGTFHLFHISSERLQQNLFGSFMLGFSFSLAFCPTMFVLFFITLMPIVLSSTYGFMLPAIFAIGTAVPLLLFIFLIWYFGGSGMMLKKGRKVGTIIQHLAGILMMLLGIFDSLVYWTS